jgi:hypothetical protein
MKELAASIFQRGVTVVVLQNQPTAPVGWVGRLMSRKKSEENEQQWRCEFGNTDLKMYIDVLERDIHIATKAEEILAEERLAGQSWRRQENYDDRRTAH